MFCNSYNKAVHGHRGPPVPDWLSRECHQTQPNPAESIALDDLPGIVRQAFAHAGVEVDVCWQPDEPEAVQDARWDADALEPDDVPPCPKCGSLEQWESMAGGWHCMACDPPHKSNLLERKAARFRRLAGTMDQPTEATP